mmetsp:Transcript_144/g.505  ORF Transcript_144/g.505 Transcript_144/m.505 type:complete len:308 (+) Transcript_144:786-1709(+)
MRATRRCRLRRRRRIPTKPPSPYQPRPEPRAATARSSPSGPFRTIAWRSAWSSRRTRAGSAPRRGGTRGETGGAGEAAPPTRNAASAPGAPLARAPRRGRRASASGSRRSSYPRRSTRHRVSSGPATPSPSTPPRGARDSPRRRTPGCNTPGGTAPRARVSRPHSASPRRTRRVPSSPAASGPVRSNPPRRRYVVPADRQGGWARRRARTASSPSSPRTARRFARTGAPPPRACPSHPRTNLRGRRPSPSTSASRCLSPPLSTPTMRTSRRRRTRVNRRFSLWKHPGTRRARTRRSWALRRRTPSRR